MADSELADERVRRLSPKERQCLRLVLGNHSSKEIARELGISQTSVDTHIRRARAKLGARDRYDAAMLLASWEAPGKGEATPAVDLRSELAARPRGAWLPPLEALNFGQRILMMVLGAIVMALVFGLILSGLAAL